MKWFDKLTGKKEEVAQTPEGEFDELETNRRAALDLEKQEATRLGKAWVAVLDTQVNPENIKNGFFEIDWNNQFIEELLDAGYSGETNEQIVDSWFRTIAMQILGDEGLETAREMGYIKVVPMDKTKSEVS